jgi:zinc transporter 1/2/3
MFGNECLGELAYEGTTAAIFMAGLFISFLVDYLAARFLLWRQGKKVPGGMETRTTLKGSDDLVATAPNSVATHMDERGVHMHGNLEERLSVVVLEAGIIFHSLRKSYLATKSHSLLN